MDEYRLVGCNFHDRLEAFAVLRQPCQIVYRNVANEVVEVSDLIVDIYAANKADFLKLSDGSEIRINYPAACGGVFTQKEIAASLSATADRLFLGFVHTWQSSSNPRVYRLCWQSSYRSKTLLPITVS